MKKKKYGKAGVFLLTLLMCLGLSLTAMAEKLPCRSATATGSYSHPDTGVIEDSGGQGNEALGQSMVTNVVDPEALIEENPSGGYYVSLRFHLMDHLSKISFSTQEPGSSQWKQVSYEQTASGGDQADMRLPVDSTDTIIRAECQVDAMGRSVIFYVTLSDFEEGNRGGFAQMDSDDADILKDVIGLTTGGHSGGKAAVPTATLAADTGNSGTMEPQQLNLSAGVWWMLFAVVFCAHVLAGLVILGVRLLLQQTLERKERMETDIVEEGTDTEELESMDLSGDRWEDLEDV